MLDVKSLTVEFADGPELFADVANGFRQVFSDIASLPAEASSVKYECSPTGMLLH